MSFISTFNEHATYKETENGAFAYSTLGSACLDLFAVLGALRTRDEEEIEEMFKLAYRENTALASKMVLYARNIRQGGLAERRTGRILLRSLANLSPELVRENFEQIVDNGRFDDLYCLEGTKVESSMWEYMFEIFVRDTVTMARNMPITMAAKWMKSINTSSKESRRLAKKFCNKFSIPEKKYRRTLAKLRAYTNVVEQKMSANKWEDIDFEAVPSYAMKNYSNAFRWHTEEQFNEYMSRVSSGNAKINASTLFPYDIIEKIQENQYSDVLEAQWAALPEYFDKGYNVVCCADVSGSMYGRPMAVSVGMALYCAEHNVGAYKGSYLTFTDTPEFFHFQDGASLTQRVNETMDHVGYDTNLDGALEAIYNVAIESGEAPDALLIVSDCEIDSFISCYDYESIVDKWVAKYYAAGLKRPKIIFWNVAARQNTYLDKANKLYVGFISGCSAGTFGELNSLITLNPYDAMVEILDKFSWKNEGK